MNLNHVEAWLVKEKKKSVLYSKDLILVVLVIILDTISFTVQLTYTMDISCTFTYIFTIQLVV